MVAATYHLHYLYHQETKILFNLSIRIQDIKAIMEASNNNLVDHNFLIKTKTDQWDF